MSCGGDGNRFSCALRKYDKHKFQSDRPSNPELHDQNQKRLSDLLRLREEQDKGIFQPVSIPNSKIDKFYKPWAQQNTPDIDKPLTK